MNPNNFPNSTTPTSPFQPNNSFPPATPVQPTAQPISGGDIVLNPDLAPKKDHKLPIIISAIAAALIIVVVTVIIIINNSQSQESAAPTTAESFNKLFNYLYTGEESTAAVENPSVTASDYAFYGIFLDTSGITDSARTEYFTKANELYAAAAENSALNAIADEFTFIYTLGSETPIDGNTIFTEVLTGEKSQSEIVAEIASSYQPLVDSDVEILSNYGELSVKFYEQLLEEYLSLQETGCIGVVINGDLKDCSNYAAAQARIDEINSVDIFSGNSLISNQDDFYNYPSVIGEQFVADLLEINSEINKN